jgi:hypothetical protein
MFIDRHKIDAAASADFCRRSTLVRVLATCVVLVAAAPAFADRGDKDDGRGNQRPQERREQPAKQAPVVQPQPRQGEPLRNEMRQFDQRAFEARAEEHRRMLQMQQDQNLNVDNGKRGGRLTADERRDLRRQINEAGNDLYANPKRR